MKSGILLAGRRPRKMRKRDFDLGEAYVDLADIDVLSAGIVPGPRLERLLRVGDGCCLGHVAVLHVRQGLLL